MKTVRLSILVLLFIVLEGTIVNLFSGSLIRGETVMTPQWTLVFLLLMSLFYDSNDTYRTLWYALVAGLFMDVAYTGVIGVHMLVYAVVVYTTHGLNKLFHTNFPVVTLLVLAGVSFADTLLYVFYSALEVAEGNFLQFILQRLGPALLVNLIVFLLLYLIFKNVLVKWRKYS
ncbi:MULTISPECIES: rod shape-determining protein MreD [Salimicrobium]|uniref:Rod shape-determining protein MreD n=1 Tax=Salimicrobium humidisoli TaxID=2029857 RepID=A0ABX4HVB6_9BACI|nr:MULTISPECIES: rod shape-determining protein MreD [Salimicrobium]PBB06782.1 rod shape-determining protein MreD [Salimicrobium humidisoli]